jgi:TolB-like protein
LPGSFRESKPDTSPRRSKSEIADQVKKSLGDTTRPPKGKDKAAALIESLVGATAAAIQSGRPVTLIPFSGEGDPAEAYADKVFADLCDLLQKDGQPQWGVSPLPLKPDANHTETVARGRQMKSRFVITGHVGGALPGTAAGFTVRLFATDQGELVWQETFETATNDAAAIARRIADEVNKRLELAPPANGQTP